MDGNYPRLESVEFEGWSASRFGGNFGVDPRTLLYGDDSDALCEIVDAIRRGLGIVEETRDGVYPRLESVEFEDRARVGFAASSTAPRERSFTTSPRTPFAKSSARFVAGSNRQRNVGATETDLSGDWARRFVSPAVVLFVLKPFPANSKSV